MSEELIQTFILMGQGMLGIFIVMALIFGVTVALNKFTGGEKEEK